MVEQLLSFLVEVIGGLSSLSDDVQRTQNFVCTLAQRLEFLLDGLIVNLLQRHLQRFQAEHTISIAVNRFINRPQQCVQVSQLPVFCS